MDPRLQTLLDKQEIEEVIHRYCRGIDRRDLELVRHCYHPDGTDQHGSFTGTVDEYVAWVDGLLDHYERTMHYIANILIEVEPDSDQAAAESYGVSLHRGVDARAHYNLATGFRFVDHFTHRDGSWKIQERVAVSEWSIEIPHDRWWPIPDHLLQGRRDAGDAIFELLTRLALAKADPNTE